MRISNERIEELIKDKGTSDGINAVNSTGVLRLALELKEAREQIELLAQQIVKQKALKGKK